MVIEHNSLVGDAHKQYVQQGQMHFATHLRVLQMVINKHLEALHGIIKMKQRQALLNL